MKAAIVREESYTLVVNGHTITEAKVVSHWEGLTKLECCGGTLIVSGLRPPAGFRSAIEIILEGEKPEGEVQVLMASPGLRATIMSPAPEPK